MIQRWVLTLFAFFCAASAVFAQTPQQELLAAAQQAFNDGFSDLASRYLEDFAQKYPQSPKLNTAKLLLGQCYFLRGQYPKALNLFEELSQQSENKDAILFWRAEAYLKQGQYAQAQSDYQTVIRAFLQSPYVPQAYYSLGWSFFEHKEFDTAKATFAQLVAKFPAHQLSEDAVLKIAECDYNAGRFQEAVKRFQQYITKFPKSLHLCGANFNIAESFYSLEQFESGLPYYQKVLDAPCDDALKLGAYTGQIWSSIKLRKFTDAENIFRIAGEFVKRKGLSTEELALAQANLAYEQGHQEAALQLFSDFIKNYPQSAHWPQGYLGRANIYYLLKKYEEAAADYRRLLDHHDPDTFVKAHFGLGWTELKLGHLLEAVNHFQTVFDQSADAEVKASALIQMADVDQEGGHLDEAAGLYERVRNAYPNNPMTDYVQYRRAIAFLKLEKVDAALLSFKNLQTDFPQSKYLEDIDYYTGVASFKKGDWASAAVTMERFLKSLTRPSEFTPEANIILALSYLNLQQPEDALRVFQKILRLYPDDRNVAKNADIGIAKCQFELGQDKEAVKRFKLAVYKYPKTEVELEALLWLAQYYLKNADAAEAIEFYKTAVDHFPENSQIHQIHYELGQAYEMQGQPDLALEQYKAIASRDEHLMAKTKLAMAGILSKDFDPQRAIAAYENIIADHPDDAGEAYLKLGQLYRNIQNYEKEIEIYQNALKVKEGHISRAQLQFNLADTLELMSRTDEAIEQYLKIPHLYPGDLAWVVKAYLRVAKIYEEGKDWQGAKVTYQKIIQLNTEEAKYAQERLDWMNKNVTRAQGRKTQN